MRLTIIANPAAGGGRAYRSIQRVVRQWRYPGWDINLLTTDGPKHAGILAQTLLQTPPDILAVCGGDGTLNEIATHLPRPPFPIAVIPAGTANVLAKELGLPLNPLRALQIALNGTVRRIDLGMVGPGNARRFLFVAGIGFDAHAVLSVSPYLKSKLGMAAYALAALNCLKNYQFPEFEVCAGNQTFTATSCLVCNSRKYGGGMVFCPDADMQDGLLDVLVIEGRRRLALLRFLLMAWMRKPISRDWTHRLRAKSLKIGQSEGVWLQVDGELAGGPPLEITLTDDCFPLVVPKGTKA